MRTRFAIVSGRTVPPVAVNWAPDWPPPRTDELVSVRAPTGDQYLCIVTAVIWYPHGDAESADPYVYVAIHDLREYEAELRRAPRPTHGSLT